MKFMNKKLTAARVLTFAFAFTVLTGATTTAQQSTGGAAQGQSTHSGHHQPPPQSGNVPYDLHFIDMMTMHHQHGIEMARLAEEKGENPRVKAFATKTREDQEKDIAELQGHREHWYKDQPKAEHQMSEGVAGPGKGHEEMQKKMEMHMNDLKANSGHGFDHQFVDLMAHHHKEGIAMAREATLKAEHAEIKTFAKNMIAKQQKETEELNQIRNVLKNSHGGEKPASGAKKGAKHKKQPTQKHSGHTNH